MLMSARVIIVMTCTFLIPVSSITNTSVKNVQNFPVAGN